MPVLVNLQGDLSPAVVCGEVEMMSLAAAACRRFDLGAKTGPPRLARHAAPNSALDPTAFAKLVLCACIFSADQEEPDAV